MTGAPASGHSPAHRQVADANRQFYAEAAERYDVSERCVVDEAERRRLRALLDRAAALVPADAAVLDACGGSGNASLALIELGLKPVTVDISPEMLAIYQRKAADLGVDVETVVADIVEFLESDTRRWDLIVFSSALHHVDDVEGLVRLAATRLADGGVVATLFDPRRLDGLPARIRRLDYFLQVATRSPGRLPRLVLARLRRSVPGDSALGKLAERHAVSGIDDDHLARTVASLGLTVKLHERDYRTGMAFAATRAMLRVLGQPSGFALLAQRPSHGSEA